MQKTSENILVAGDITEYKYTEAALRQELQRERIALQHVKDAVILTDAYGLIAYVNPAAETCTGWRDEAAHGLSLPEVCTMLDAVTRRPLADPVEQCLRQGRTIGPAGHGLLVRRDGHERSVEYTTTLCQDRGGGSGGGRGAVHGCGPDVSRCLRGGGDDTPHSPPGEPRCVDRLDES